MMDKDLTTEEIVTKLLTSNEVLTPLSDSIEFNIVSPKNYDFGEFLESVSESDLEDLKSDENMDSKYTFIKI